MTRREFTDEREKALDTDLAFSEFSNMKRLISLHGQWFRYETASKSWFVWDEVRWVKDDRIKIEYLAKLTIRDMYREASIENNDSRRKALAGHALKTETVRQIKSMVELCKSEPSVVISPNDLDANDMLLNCANCTINLDVTTWEHGYPSCKDHDPHDLITKYTPVVFDPTAECPVWSNFLMDVMNDDVELVHFLRRAIAYSLLGGNPESKMFFMWGSGSNGKSTFINAISTLFGDYSKNAQPETFMRKSDDKVRDDLARLRGARLVTANETDEGQALAENLIKQLTGGDKMTARFLYGEQFEFTPNFKMWMSGNHKPTIRGVDHGIWRRMLLIPFTVTIDAVKKDPQLGAKLQAEMSGILNWALQGLIELEFGLLPPKAVLDATNAYRDEMDHIGTFMGECTEKVAGSTCLIGDFYLTYEEWCESNGEKPMSKRVLTRKMEERGFKKVKRNGWEWIGVKLIRTKPDEK